MSSQRWIHVAVPEHLAGDVVRFVADQLDEAGEAAAGASAPDDPEDQYVWWSNLDDTERKLLRFLHEFSGEEVDAAEVAAALDMTTRELGGVLGPFNKRMRQEGHMPAVKSRQASVSGRRVKRLSLVPNYLGLVSHLPNEEPDVRVVKVRKSAVKKSSRSKQR